MFKYFISSVYLLSLICFSQNELPIVLDGKLNDPFWSSEEYIIKTENITIKEDSVYYYAAIKTQQSSMTNILILNGTKLSILHSSMSIGKASYELKKSKGSLKKGFSNQESSWDFRDPSLRNSKNIDVIEELNQCLKINGWASNTMNIGNNGEKEFVINKRLIPKGSSICIMFGMFNINYFPKNSTITPSKIEDSKLHMATTLNTQKFRISNWFEL